MIYQQAGNGSPSAYPDHNIPADKKGMEWCMAYAKAAYYDFFSAYPKGVFANNGGDYQKFRMYALGKQPITQYRKWLGIDNSTDHTWLSVDWTVRAVVSGYRDKAISRLMKEDYSVVATPIDMLAKTEMDDYYNKMKAKLAVRQLMLQQTPDLASHPLITLQSGEPLDIEELEMRLELGEQFNRSKDAEMAIAVGFYENNYSNFRKAIYEDLFDFGVAGYREWLGDDNKAKFRRVDPECVITSVSKDGTFSDIVHAGEQIDVSLIDLAGVTDEAGNPLFTEAELQEFAGSIAGKFGNPRALGINTGWMKPYDRFKCKVADIEFYTYNEMTYTDRKDKNNNPVFKQEQSGRGEANNPRYKRKRIQYVYKCKWIVGTDKCYDWGMCYDQKRDSNIKTKARTKLSFSFIAYNFYQMKAQGFMERLIPYLDEYQLTMLKIQNFKNRSVPSGWWINLDMLENVALNKGGKNMQPRELLQMFFETGVLVGRSLDGAGNPIQGNVQPIIPIENTAASELAMFYQDIVNILSMIEKMTGYNDITSGNPNPKTLVPGYQTAQQSTNEALYPMQFAEESLSCSLASDVLCRMKQGVQKEGIGGYAPALNNNLLRFIQISPEISLRDYGIELEKKTTDDQKAWLLQQMQIDIQNGFLNTSDAVMLVNTKNVKQAQSIWSYRVKKEKEKMQENEMAKINANNQGAQQAAQITQQGQMQQLQMEYDFKLKLKQMEVYAEIETKRMEVEGQRLNNQETNAAKVQVQETANDGKIIAQHLANQKETATT